jgi:hypothetical protein
MSYETDNTDPARSTLRVRDDVDSAKTPIPSYRWGVRPHGRGSLEPTTTDICLFGGFKADRLYELIYPAKDPIVMALGFAATRDIASLSALPNRP